MGKVLAYISIFYGMSGVDLSLEPVFGENIKEGSIFLKGNICIFSVLVIALRVYRNEQFKSLFPDRELCYNVNSYFAKQGGILWQRIILIQQLHHF